MPLITVYCTYPLIHLFGLLSLGVALTLNGPTHAADQFIVLQSTTSTQNSGLFDYLLPSFQKQTGIEVRVVAVGTGQALKNAQNGDADVLLVHAEGAEQQFVTDRWGVRRYDVMYNDFVIVGPAADPAKLSGMRDALVSFKKLAETQAIFVSRGDDSGTHKKEQALWEAAAIDPTTASGSWYRETGSGMGATLNTAVGMTGYTLTDRATWISFQNKVDFQVLVQGDPQLFNQYGIILVNPAKHPHVKAALGQRFIDWLISSEGQALIADYHIGTQQLFFPNASEDK